MKLNAKKKVEEKPTIKKRRGTQHIALEVLVYLANDKRAHAPGREQGSLSSRLLKNYQFSSTRFKAIAS